MGGGSGEGAPSGSRRATASVVTARTTPAFFTENRRKILTAIADRVAQIGLPKPHARLTWASNEEAIRAFGAAIWAFVDLAAPEAALKQLMKLSYPADLIDLVDDARRGPDGTRLEVALIRITTAFDEPLRQSILRMGARTVVQLDRNGGTRPHPSSIIASSPLDGVVVEVLLKPTITLYGFKKKGAPEDTVGRPFATGAQGLSYKWLGSRDRSLWNWIHVTSPANATAEDVAQLNLVGQSSENSEQAYRIASNPPYFGIPFETARHVDAAVNYAPEDVKRKVRTGPGPRVTDASVLARSVISDDAALADAPKSSRTDLSIERAIDRTQSQLDFMRVQLKPWGAARHLSGAIAFVERRKSELSSDPRKAHRYAAAPGI